MLAIFKHIFRTNFLILCSLNTDIQAVNGLKCIDFGNFNVNVVTIDELVKEIMNGIIPLSEKDTYIGSFILGSCYRIIIQPYINRNYASAILFSYASKGVIFYEKAYGILKKYTTNWTTTQI